jgi:hypothetical protein
VAGFCGADDRVAESLKRTLPIIFWKLVIFFHWSLLSVICATTGENLTPLNHILRTTHLIRTRVLTILTDLLPYKERYQFTKVCQQE